MPKLKKMKNGPLDSMFATPKQLADIQALRKNIAHLVTLLNRPYAMVFTVIVFPTLVNILLTNEESPFREIMYDYEYEKAYFDDFKAFEDFKHLYRLNFDETYKDIQRVQKNFQDTITSVFNPVLARVYGTKNLNFDQIMVKFEEALLSVSDLDTLNQFKMIFIEAYNYLIIPYNGLSLLTGPLINRGIKIITP
jgi:hypothetical protein